MTSEEILDEFYNTVTLCARPATAGRSRIQSEQWRGQKPMYDVINADSGEVMFKSGEKITPRKADAGGQGRPQAAHHPDRGNLRPLLGL